MRKKRLTFTFQSMCSYFSRMHSHIICITLKCIKNVMIQYIDRKCITLNKTLRKVTTERLPNSVRSAGI